MSTQGGRVVLTSGKRCPQKGGAMSSEGMSLQGGSNVLTREEGTSSQGGRDVLARGKGPDKVDKEGSFEQFIQYRIDVTVDSLYVPQ